VCKGENGLYRPEPVPEHPGRYPEANMFGLTPAYGLYIRHADGVVLTNVTFRLAEGRTERRQEIVKEDCR
jgi:hypothetical protein